MEQSSFYPNLESTYQEFLNKDHGFLFKAAGTYRWWRNDSRKHFHRNIEKLKYYIDYPITYKINKQLYRSEFDFDDIKGKDVDLALGCSHTLGVGHTLENTWPYRLSKKTNRTIINLGLSGSGAEMAYLNLKRFISFFNVKNVFHFQPIYSRYYFFDGNLHKTFLVTKSDLDSIPYKEDYVKKILVSDEFIYHNHFRSIDACKGVCNDYGANYYHINEGPENREYFWGRGVSDAHFKSEVLENDIPARDLAHFSVNTLKAFADKFYEML